MLENSPGEELVERVVSNHTSDIGATGQEHEELSPLRL